MSSYEPHSGGFDTPPPPPPPLNFEKRIPVKAIFSVLFGLASMAFWVFAALPAIILAVTAKSDIDRDPARLKGRGLANFGLALGIFGLFAPLIWAVVLFRSYVDDAVPTLTGSEERLVHLHFNGTITESPIETWPGFQSQYMSLKDILEQIDDAAYDDSVLGMVITADAPALGTGQIEELRSAFGKFQEADKKIYAHGSALRTGSYALLAGADHINLIPTDSLWLTGLYMESIFLREALEMIGVEADMLHMGDYKAAGEMFTHSEPSEPAEENMNWLIDGLYEGIVGMIADGRGIDTEAAEALVDDGPYGADRAMEIGLIDSVMHRDEFIDMVRAEFDEDIAIDNYYGYDNSAGSPGIFSLLFADTASEIFQDDDTIAIIYVDGAIYQGYATASPFGQVSGVFSGNLTRYLRYAEEDDSIQAVVLRVSSPGGSAVASEEILHAVTQVQKEKPVVVSMGDTAASGGYYVSARADSIFADEMTITASIGVVGGKFVMTELWDSLGVNFHGYKRGENADLLSSSEAFSDDQRDRMLDYMEDTYEAFKTHVVEGRGAKLTKPIDEIAGGRVFTGKQAYELGLVDQIGGLDDAIEYAAELADLDSYTVRVLPEPLDFFEAFMQGFSGSQSSPTDLHTSQSANFLQGLGAIAKYATPDATQTAMSALAKVDPLRVRATLRAFEALQLLSEEGVIAMMPQVMILR